MAQPTLRLRGLELQLNVAPTDGVGTTSGWRAQPLLRLERGRKAEMVDAKDGKDERDQRDGS